MKKELKGLAVGLIAGVCLTSAVTAFADNAQVISAVFDKVNLKVNGATLNAKTLLYDGTTYVPIRNVAEALGAEVKYDAQTATADIVSSEKKNTDKIAVENDDEVVKSIYASVTAIPTTMEYSDKKFSGTRDMTATVTNYSSFILTDYKAEYINAVSNKTYTVRPKSSISLNYGESFTNVVTMPASSFEGDLKMTSCTYTLSDGKDSVKITYSPSTGKYTIE